ncbi:protein-glutamate O-methyltransferase CheR [Ramlibacter tataouinensis]|uniref:CheR family methyltransferase n=1 Tax=Ramlibacter tataouinensis TaxID=94132 RepID=UPI0022F3B673|nr:protein-glutamate O-methyltransferase CheR [Ramlibacter tataouinensis]WBY00219.1 protein-glutamate O-methyltransferase CheR [Ramlibacter tataouinensis]
MSPAPPPPLAQAIGEQEFRAFSTWLHREAGIHLGEQKKALVAGRLASRLRHHGLQRFGEYYELLHSPRHAPERQIALDLLTTNETSFFREPRHFDFLRERIVPAHAGGKPLRVWSAACSSGEEPYSIALVLCSTLGDRPWEVLASDLSSRVLERARQARYPMARAGQIPTALLHAHCLKGTGRHEGQFAVAPEAASRVRFQQVNLNGPLPALGEFELILLRNVMIYFDASTKQAVLDRVLACLRPGGHLLIGHSESLAGLRTGLRPVAPAIYLKP